MKSQYYTCDETGVIVETECETKPMFSTAKKYSVLYKEELPRFLKSPRKIYGLPFSDVPHKIYNGVGRLGFDIASTPRKKLSPEQKKLYKEFVNDISVGDSLMSDENLALQLMSLFEDADDYELIWVRNSGTKSEIPNGYKFIGYDISCFCDFSGAFSIICDCMFICRWHGCDFEGQLFASDFEKLNANGLFDTWQNAYDYMVKYFNAEWTERGSFCIYEIYKSN